MAAVAPEFGHGIASGLPISRSPGRFSRCSTAPTAKRRCSLCLCARVMKEARQFPIPIASHLRFDIIKLQKKAPAEPSRPSGRGQAGSTRSTQLETTLHAYLHLTYLPRYLRTYVSTYLPTQVSTVSHSLVVASLPRLLIPNSHSASALCTSAAAGERPSFFPRVPAALNHTCWSILYHSLRYCAVWSRPSFKPSSAIIHRHTLGVHSQCSGVQTNVLVHLVFAYLRVLGQAHSTS